MRVNSSIITDGRNGFVAASHDEWIEKLARLLADTELRKRFADEGRKTVEARYSAGVEAPRVLEILERASRGSTGAPEAAPIDARRGHG